MSEARPAEVPHLTSRQKEVLQLVVRGMTNRQVASNLYITETTAKFHVLAFIAKFGVANRTALAFVAVKSGCV